MSYPPSITVSKHGDEIHMKTTDFDKVLERLLEAETATESALETHSDCEGNLERLQAVTKALVAVHHAEHDQQFTWVLCSRYACREVAISLGLR